MSKLTDAEIDALPYRRGVGIVLLNGNDQVFVAQRLDNPEPAWQMPQGGIDKGEEPLAAAWRELYEETGVKSAVLLEETPGWLRYDLPRELVPHIWKGQYRGQKQKWFAFRFNGNDTEIDINGEHPEFSAWRWADLKQTPDFIVGFKRPLYEQVVAAFKHLVG
ncbi:RNA pyrophosphohydrolase [Dongia mobilis]|uniref:RNA pyrophosphohydrolase n=1 Tax=Dongia sp. TaxID=1977262 RepID=UPI0026EA6386